MYHLVGVFDNGAGYEFVEDSGIRKSVNFPLNFAMNLKLL